MCPDPDDDPPLSILFDRGQAAMPPAPEPACFGDLHLDAIVARACAGREEYELEPFFHQPLHDPDSVVYRQQVVRDLERTEVGEAVRRFAAQMREVRDRLTLSHRLHHRLQKQRWFLDAASGYCEALVDLDAALGAIRIGSEGLRRVAAYLGVHLADDRFRSLRSDVATLERGLAEVRYLVHVTGLQVRVLPSEERLDLGAEIEATFEKFARGSVKNYRKSFREARELNHVESQILDGVAALHPDVFAALGRFCSNHDGFRDAAFVRIDRELQFYLGYLALLAPLRAAGLPFAEPRVSSQSKRLDVRETFDLALVLKLSERAGAVVRNDLELAGGERIIVVTGPNNGGKTTLARTVGQLHHLAALGLPVPGSSAQLFLPDRVLTHFGVEERIETQRGKLEDELHRMRALLEQATADSVLIVNEAFSSTTLHDARMIGTRVIEQMVALDAIGVVVTFIDELACIGETVVSMMSTVRADDPAVRTHRVVRKPADGLAYAVAIADKHGLGYEGLRRRIAR